MYAGYLCATQVNARIDVTNSPHPHVWDRAPVLIRVVHGGPGGNANRRRDHGMTGSVLVIVRDAAGRQYPHTLDQATVVRVEDPHWAPAPADTLSLRRSAAAHAGPQPR